MRVIKADLIVALCVGAVLASCAGADASASPTPMAATSHEVAQPSSTADEPSTAPASASTASPPSATASASPRLATPDIEVGGHLRVTGNGLAVRAGPGLQHPLVSEFLLGHDEPIETTLLRDEVRLPAGHVVLVVLGPIVVDQTTWYAVANVPQDGQSRQDAPIWRSVAPVPYSEIDFQLTWMAVAQPGATFVEVADPPSCADCFGDVPELTAVAAGRGSGRIGPWANSGVAYITMAAAAHSESSTCEFQVTNQDGHVMFLEEPMIDYVEAFIPGVSPGQGAEAWLDITGDCAWAVNVVVAEG
jgi:hypothetical protein